MIYFRKREIVIESLEDIEKNLNQSTTRVQSMFDMNNTSTYVIFEERPLIGQKLKNGRTIISRYRHIFFQIVPRIVSKWELKSINDRLVLVIKSRLGLFSSIALFLITFPMVVEIIKSILNFEFPDLETVTHSFIWIAIFLFLMKFELTFTDRTILKVINKEKVKSLVTI